MKERKLTVGEKLRELRIAKGKTQAEVAKSIGVSVSSIGMYEIDKRVPSDSIKVKLAKCYGKSVTSIFFTT